MSERVEISLSVDVPAVTETPTHVQVRCGQTVVSVHEHGRTGSGAWMVWTLGGNRATGGTHEFHATIGEALADARQHVRRVERERLLHNRLSAVLAGGGQDD